MSYRRASAALLVPVLGACASTNSYAQQATTARRIVPLVDHHQHLVSPGAISPSKPAPPFIELPAELKAVLDARNRSIETGEAGNLYADDAMVLEPTSGAWLRGKEGVDEIVAMYSKDSRIFANGYTLGQDVATITGVMRSGEYKVDEINFTFTLKRDASRAWRIVNENASLFPPREFAEAVTVDRLIGDLDDVGIERAVVLSVAFWFGEEETMQPNEYEKTKAENDWTAAQVARFPNRLIAFCGIAPLKEYAEMEMRRCAKDLGMRGIKMHFRSANVNLHNPSHVARVRRVFEVANELGLAIVVHAETPGDFGTYDRDEAEIFLNQIASAAPKVVVQIAHLWGGNAFSPDALDVYAKAASSGDPRWKNLYFDLTEVTRGAGGNKESLAQIARYARQIGMDRLLYGSDASASPDLPPSTLGWGRLRRALPLTDAEFADIADNIAPYLR